MQKNILFITDVTQPGGVNTYIYNLAKFARTYHWNITLLVDDNQGIVELCNKLTQLNIISYKKNIRHNNSISLKSILLNIILKHQISIIHLHCGSPKSMLELREITIKEKIPFLFTEQFVPSNLNYNKSTIQRIKKIYFAAEAIITVSNNNLKIIQKIFKNGQENFYMIPNSIDLLEQNCNKKFISKSKYKFLFLGRLVEQKGIDILIKAINNTSFSFKEKSTFDIYGTGEEIQNLKKMVSDFKIEKNINFYSWSNKPHTLYKNYDAFVLPSRNEGQPFTLLEAMSYCLPCIASNASGIQEVFSHNKYGTGFTVEDDQMLANILEDFVENPYPYYEKSQLAIDFLSKNYNNSINLKKTLNIWINILEKTW